ncbi:MAG: DUF4286 family protein [Gammaproteobacteria bacterium]|nr:DUF4286 family protein [Gammaproteobacteria bacterium]
MSHQHIIYQVDMDIDGEVADSFDVWLGEHIDDMLAIAGFVSAEVLADTESVQQGVVHRSVQYRIKDRQSLEHYLSHDAERMRAEGQRRFGGYFKATRKILSAGGPRAGSAELELLRSCRNCSAPLTGQYCHACGQRDRKRMISVWELFRDLIGDLFEIDSRLWRSVLPLLLRPGKLTEEYLAGRQVYYTPPLRMYLVVSILFFLVASFGGDGSRLTISGEQLSDSAVISSEAQQESIRQCDELDINLGSGSLAQEEIPEIIKQVCRRIAVDRGKTFLKNLYDNLPTMVFLFLPLIAMVQKILYIFSRRYYVEHLLFFVHFHSFFFLNLTVSVLLSRIPDFFGAQGVLVTLMIIALSVYIPVYLFKAMRRVYGQSFFVTLIKYVLLFVAYHVCLTMTMLAGFVYTALSV